MSAPRQPQILMRPSLADPAELAAAKRAGFRVHESRCAVGPGRVIGRYSVLPGYNELVADLGYRGATLAHCYALHYWVASFEWVRHEGLALLTARTWFGNEFAASDHPGPFVVRGRTNSRKGAWKRRMFAPDREAAIRVGLSLLDDDEIARQGLVYREFVPLRSFGQDEVTGIPLANEWRVFCWRGRVLTRAPYWQTGQEAWAPEADALVQRVLAIPETREMFLVVDVAEKAAGGWMVVELNDGQMSGLQGTDPDEFYRALYRAAREPE